MPSPEDYTVLAALKKIPGARRAIEQATAAAYKKNKGGGKSTVDLGTALKDIDPTSYLDIPSMDGRLSGELLAQYNKAVQTVLGSTFQTGVRNSASINESAAAFLQYQQDAIAKLASAYQTLGDPNASHQDKSYAQAWVDKLSTSNLGDVHDKNSPFVAYKDGGPGWFNQDAPYGAMTPDEEAGLLGSPEMLDPEDFTTVPDIDQRAKVLKEGLEGLDWTPPDRKTVKVESIGDREVDPRELIEEMKREVQDGEKIDPALADLIVSKWDDPEFLANLDKSGQEAMMKTIAYYDELLANDGRDAVSDAYMHRQTQEAERRRKAAVDAALANLDTRGMAGSGYELAAYMRGAGQSAQDQFTAAMEASAMQQQRRDNAAEQRAVVGEARQLLENGLATTMAEAIDLATQQRAKMKQEIEEHNAGKVTSAADKTFDTEYQRREHNAGKHTSAGNMSYEQAGVEALKNADLAENAASDTFEAGTDAKWRRNETISNGLNAIFDTGTDAVTGDRNTKLDVLTGNREAEEGGKARVVDQSNAAKGLTLSERSIAAQEKEAEPNAADIVSAGGDALETFANLYTAVRPRRRDDED